MKNYGSFWVLVFAGEPLLTKYRVGVAEGVVYVARPDGYVGFATRLDAGEEVGDFFARIFTGSK